MVAQLCPLRIIASYACFGFSSIPKPKRFNETPVVMDKIEAKCVFRDIINNNRLFLSVVVFSYQNFSSFGLSLV